MPTKILELTATRQEVDSLRSPSVHSTSLSEPFLTYPISTTIYLPLMASLGQLAPRNLATRISRRAFHSYEHHLANHPSTAVENAILSAAYRHVPKQGFSHRSLMQGARDAGYLDISPSVLSDGAFSLIRFHLVNQRSVLAEKCEMMHGSRDNHPADRIAVNTIGDIMWRRLLANKEIIHQWQEALAIMAQPKYIPFCLKELALLSDEIWYIAGDKSVDFSWYTKRASLSMIYSISELFMTNDESAGFVDTRDFMIRRLNDAATGGGLLTDIGTWSSFTMNAAINVLRSKGARL